MPVRLINRRRRHCWQHGRPQEGKDMVEEEGQQTSSVFCLTIVPFL
jgi:hypothetical protein